MPDHGESLVLAGIAVVLISIPAAPQTVEISSGDSMAGVIDSKFSDRFKVEFKPGKIFNKLVDSNSKLTVNRSYNKNVKMLQTAEGFVKVVETNSSIEKTVQTPYGRFEFGVRNGKNYSDFTGNEESRDKALELREELTSLLERKVSESREKHRIVVQEMLPDISVAVNDDPDVEHVNLTNNGEEDVDLSGWKAVSTDGDSNEYMNLTEELESGESLTIFTGHLEDKINDFENAVYREVNIYSDGVLKVYNSGERKIVSKNY